MVAEGESRHRAISISMLVAQLVLAIALPLSAVALYGLYREAYNEYTAGENMVMRVVETTAEDTTQFINATRELVQKLAQRPAIRALDVRHCDPVLQEIPGLFTHYTNALTVDADGTRLCTAAPLRSAAPRKVPPQFWFDELRQHGAVVVGQPARGMVSGKWVSTIAARIWRAPPASNSQTVSWSRSRESSLSSEHQGRPRRSWMCAPLSPAAACKSASCSSTAAPNPARRPCSIIACLASRSRSAR